MKEAQKEVGINPSRAEVKKKMGPTPWWYEVK
jgi:hypothetical protein